MMILEELHEYGEELDRLLRLRTLPFGVKMLNNQRDIPKKAERPVCCLSKGNQNFVINAAKDAVAVALFQTQALKNKAKEVCRE